MTAPALPPGWTLDRTESGAILVKHLAHGGCLVTADESAARVTPARVLHALASDLLAARTAPAEPVLPALPETDAWHAIFADATEGGACWLQWHDRSDPPPEKWEGEPPSEIIKHYAESTLTAYARAAVLADRAAREAAPADHSPDVGKMVAAQAAARSPCIPIVQRIRDELRNADDLQDRTRQVLRDCMALFEAQAAAPAPQAETKRCRMDCTTVCLAQLHGCASECVSPFGVGRPTPAAQAAPGAPAEPTDAQIKAAITAGVQAGSISWLGYEKDNKGRYTLPSIAPYHYQLARAVLALKAPAAPAAVAPAWQPISTAPQDMAGPAVVRWFDADGAEHHELDYTEEGCWMGWHNHAEHVEVIGGHGVSYTPPYEHWMRLPPAPDGIGTQEQGAQR